MQEQIIYLSEYTYMRCFGNSEEMQCTASMWAAARRNKRKTAYVLSVQITIGAECQRIFSISEILQSKTKWFNHAKVSHNGHLII